MSIRNSYNYERSLFEHDLNVFNEYKNVLLEADDDAEVSGSSNRLYDLNNKNSDEPKIAPTDAFFTFDYKPSNTGHTGGSGEDRKKKSRWIENWQQKPDGAWIYVGEKIDTIFAPIEVDAIDADTFLSTERWKRPHLPGTIGKKFKINGLKFENPKVKIGKGSLEPLEYIQTLYCSSDVFNQLVDGFSGSLPSGIFRTVVIDGGSKYLRKTAISGLGFIQIKELDLIDNACFAGMPHLTIADLSESRLKEIPKQCFYQLTNLKEVMLPDSVTLVEDLAFAECSSLRSVKNLNPAATYKIGCFDGCKRIQNMPVFTCSTIPDQMCRNCESLSNIQLEDSVTSIGSDAFRNCKILEKVVIKNPDCNIEAGAFANCSSNLVIDTKRRGAVTDYAEISKIRFAINGQERDVDIIDDRFGPKMNEFLIELRKYKFVKNRDGNYELRRNGNSIVVKPVGRNKVELTFNSIKQDALKKAEGISLVGPDGRFIDPEAFDNMDPGKSRTMSTDDALALIKKNMNWFENRTKFRNIPTRGNFKAESIETTPIVYHVSDKKFDRFSHRYVNLNNAKLPGFFFATDADKDLGQYGDYRYKCKLDLNNEIHQDKVTLAPELIAELSGYSVQQCENALPYFTSDYDIINTICPRNSKSEYADFVQKLYDLTGFNYYIYDHENIIMLRPQDIHIIHDLHEDLPDYLKMPALIDACIEREVKPQDIFDTRGCKFVDPKMFFDKITEGTKQSYKEDPKKRIMLNGTSSLYYQVLLAFLDDIDGKGNYKKLQPAEYTTHNGEFIPTDGRHRAQLCMLLGIKLPVKEQQD